MLSENNFQFLQPRLHVSFKLNLKLGKFATLVVSHLLQFMSKLGIHISHENHHVMYITHLSQGVVKDVITPIRGLLGFLDFPHLLLDGLHFRLDGLHRFLDSLYLSLDYFDYFQFCVHFISTLMSLSVVEVSVLSSPIDEGRLEIKVHSLCSCRMMILRGSS